jgi:hypothetical protein
MQFLIIGVIGGEVGVSFNLCLDFLLDRYKASANKYHQEEKLFVITVQQKEPNFL